MKIIIGCLNSKYIHASLAPWCLLGGVREFCKTDVTSSVVESTINADLDEFIQNIKKANVYAFSCYIWNIQQTLYVCKKLKERFDCKIILGGPEVAYRAKDVLQKYNFIDFVLSGEGEFNFPKLIDVINMSLSLSGVDGLTYRENNDILSVPEATYNITPPNPYSKEFFDACFDVLGCEKSEAVMIGDSISADIKGAKNYGLTSIWMKGTKEGDCPFTDYTVTKLEEIKGIL